MAVVESGSSLEKKLGRPELTVVLVLEVSVTTGSRFTLSSSVSLRLSASSSSCKRLATSAVWFCASCSSIQRKKLDSSFFTSRSFSDSTSQRTAESSSTMSRFSVSTSRPRREMCSLGSNVANRSRTLATLSPRRKQHRPQ